MTTFLALLGVFLIGLSKAGFATGLGMLSTPLVAQALPARLAIGVILPLLCLADVFTLAVYWKRWEAWRVGWLLVGTVIGILSATAFVSSISELALRRLEHTRLVAPFDGVLIGGDLGSSLGMAVQRGQELMIVAPDRGWRLVADALANIQVCLLDENGAATPVGRESTQQLFESLQHALPRERYQEIMAYSAQVVMAWQQARRQAH